MGKIKSKSIRRAAKKLSGEGVQFSKDFDQNKSILKGLVISKKLRNQLAGLTANITKRKSVLLN